MSTIRNLANFAGALGILIMAGSPAVAQVTISPSPTPGAIDLNTYQSIQQREQFQSLQRQHRAEERQMLREPMPRPQVPVTRQSCQYGFRGAPVGC